RQTSRGRSQSRSKVREMSLDADVGAGIELGGFSLKALLDIGAELGGMHATLKKLRRNEEAYQFGAVQVRLNGTAPSDSGSDTIEMGLGGPTYGRMWQ